MPASTIEHEQARTSRPPRAMAWTFLLASSSAVLLAGLAATGLVFGQIGEFEPPPSGFWPRLLAAGALTAASVSLRGLRWVFLLRRAETRIPIRDAFVGYLAGLSLLFAPLLLGEIALRGLILKQRGRVPVLTTAMANLVERSADLLALGFVAATFTLAAGETPAWAYGILSAFVISWLPQARRMTIAGLSSLVSPVCRVFDPADAPEDFPRFSRTRTWAALIACSVGVWLLPGIGLWLIAGTWMPAVSWLDAQRIYTSSSAIAALMLAPGGVLIAGPEMIQRLLAAGLAEPAAAMIVLGVRLATVGVAVALGAVFLLVHLRSLRTRAARSEGPGAGAACSSDHFDAIADAYDVQIPESRRLALLERKTRAMIQVIESRGAGRSGLDVGCGQGAYVQRMRALGFDVVGIDASPAQVRLAQRRLGGANIVTTGSALAIPAADGSFDFLFTINVLHHLASVEEQRRAFAELLRVLKPGGLLFVHEINTRNVVFRFYMGYVFPSLNCIDEGVERWLLPQRLAEFTSAPVAAVEYFTFLPDFVPAWIVRWLAPIERRLERSRLKIYSAHYMAVLIKPPDRQ